MSELSLSSDWFEHFFKGAALDLWRQAISPEQTENEIEFLQEVLQPTAGARLLDIPCGNGRLAIPLSRLGYKVCGVDFSSDFIAEARANAASEKLKIDFVQSDMRDLKLPLKYDGACCMGNSFGYFDRAGTEQFFKATAGSLKSGAHFVLDSLMVAETFLVNGAEREWLKVGNSHMLIENSYDAKSSRVETTYTFLTNGKEEKRQALHHIYTCGELVHMLEKASFDVVDLYSDLEFAQYELGSDRLLLVAKKR